MKAYGKSNLLGSSQMETLPVFRYHPDPLATGAIKSEPDRPCLGCNRIRGYLYMGPVHVEKNFILEEHLCPWCIADGTAAKRFGARFNDTGSTDGITDQVREEVESRTPGYSAWQEEQWLACCGDAAAFLGLAGAVELKRDFPDAIPAVKTYLRDEYSLSKDEMEEFFSALSKEDMPTAYIFRCLHCRKFLAYVDET
jgi:uncharacterized protein CbrC (UPF0167 family)